MKVRLCLEGRSGNSFDFFFFLGNSEIDLQTSTYIIYKSAGSENTKSAALGTVL